MLNRKFIAVIFLLIVFNQTTHGKEGNCQNYPYKEGLYIKKVQVNPTNIFILVLIVLIHFKAKKLTSLN